VARHPLRWILPAGAFLLAAGIAFFARLIAEVRAGRGAVPYTTHWGYDVTPIGVLAGTGIGAVAVAVVAIVLGWRERREERDFARKYGRGRRTPPAGPS
jgi:hypothetical protein